MTGKEFLWQYIMIDRQIRSVKLQLDSMAELVSRNMMNDTFQHDINELSDNLKSLISESATVKKSILDKIQIMSMRKRMSATSGLIQVLNIRQQKNISTILKTSMALRLNVSKPARQFRLVAKSTVSRFFQSTSANRL